MVAFENTKNYGAFQCSQREITINIDFPNSYYSHVGTRLVLPYIKLSLLDSSKKTVNTEVIQLGEVGPFRLLSYPTVPTPRDSPLFYSRENMDCARTQEEILRDSVYQFSTPSNFWGKSIPHP